MIKSTTDQIKHLAQEYSKSQVNWHFHILTPECQLNETDQYALVLENTDSGETHVCYSASPYMDIGQELVKLLHGDEVIKEESEEKPQPPSPQVEKMLLRAKEMIKANKFWHHHMLFPGCKFNQHGKKWVIVFEDSENNEVIESISDDEPKNDLQHIEALFYSQKKP